MNTETSAGGIVICRKERNVSVLLIKDMHNNWTFPKGHIEAGETQENAARREILEETGVKDIRFIRTLSPVTYWFTRTIPIHKTIYYFLFESPQEVALVAQKEEGISEAIWESIDHVEDKIGYPKTNALLLSEVRELL